MRPALRRRLLLGVALLVAPGGCRRSPLPASCFTLEAPAEPVGFDAAIAIGVRPACAELRRGRVDWRQVSGPSLRALGITDGGFRLTARMPPLAEVVPMPLPWGVVPISPRTQGEIVVEATWRGDRGQTLTRRARVSAAPRSRGLPNTPVGARVYLGGAGWSLRARPVGSHAALAADGPAASLLPDVAGDWQLADGAGRTLALRTARYDQTPLDCGRRRAPA